MLTRLYMRIEDKTQAGVSVVATLHKRAFLTLHERVASHAHREGEKRRQIDPFYGGYDDAEGRIIMFVSDGYADTLESAKMIHRFQLLHIRVVPGSESSHRDYLGSVLSLEQ